MKGHHVNWTPEMDALLGTDTDKRIAAALGLHTMTVWARRKRLAIEARGSSYGGAPEVMARLGKVPDGVLAREAGVIGKTIGDLRRRLGIPPWSVHREVTIRRMFAEGATDEQIAAALDTSDASIKVWRSKHGLRRVAAVRP